MQIFILGSIYETAKYLDNKRFHRQLSEAEMIYKGILGENGWGRNILATMYRPYINYLKLYIKTFREFKNGCYFDAYISSIEAEKYKPEFICDKYINNMKSRLYTKDPLYYNMFSGFGKSYINLYYINDKWREYKQK